MNAATLLTLAAMLQEAPSAQQTLDSSFRTDTSGVPATQTILSRSLLLRLPIDDPREALILVPGVVRRGTTFGIGAGDGLSFRGGGRDAAAVYVDGVPIRNLMTGVPALTLATDGVDAIAVTRGPAGVELADRAGGGAVEYTIPSGGARIDGHLVGAADGNLLRFAGSVGGPIGSHVSWFVAGDVNRQDSPYRGMGAADQPAFVWGGVDTIVGGVVVPNFIETTGRERPLDWTVQTRSEGKVTAKLGASTLAFTYLISRAQRRFFPGPDVGDTALFSGARSASRLVVANWTQPLRRGTVSPTLHAVLALGHDDASSGLLTATSQAASVDPGVGYFFSSRLAFLGSDSIAKATDQIIRNIRSNAGLRVPFLNQTSLRNVQPYRLNPYGLVAGWPTAGSDGTLAIASENRFDGRVWVDWDLTTRHHLRLGGDYSRATQAAYQSTLLNEIDLDAWIAHPHRLGAFAADRITWPRLTIDVGARLDHFTPGGSVPLVPGRIFSNPAWNPQSGVNDSAYTLSVARVYRTASGKSAVSPELRAAFQATPRTKVLLNVSRVVEPPSSAQVFGGSNADFAFTSTFTSFGRDVNYVSTTTAALGVRSAVGSHLAFDLDGYLTHRALYIDLIKSFDDPANPGRTLNLPVTTPIDSIGAGGIEGAVQWNATSAVSGRLVYGFERSQSSTTQSIGVLGQLTTPATLGPALRDLSVVTMVHAESGIPYMRGVFSGLGVTVFDDVDPAFLLFGSKPNARLPWTTSLDLRLRKEFTVKGEASLYVDLRNALNIRNIIGAFTDGSQADAIYQQNVLNPEFASLRSEAQANGTLVAGNTIDLRPDCGTWTGTTSGPVDCAALRLVERRFGNGDGLYDVSEQTAALDAYFNAFFGASRFYAPGRAARIGVELTF
ncbi:MAG TPA: TonB-dependent receptor [Gemmatimonadales bacterium]|nr:TonB-dependent receptor [Gemmatimonadales bacterium]